MKLKTETYYAFVLSNSNYMEATVKEIMNNGFVILSGVVISDNEDAVETKALDEICLNLNQVIYYLEI